MAEVTLFYHGTEQTRLSLEPMWQAANIAVTDMGDSMPFALLDAPALIYWENAPSKDEPRGKLLRLLHTLPNTEIVVGSGATLFEDAKGRFKTQGTASSTSSASETAEVSESDIANENQDALKSMVLQSQNAKRVIMLVAPQDNYPFIKDRVARHGYQFASMPVPLKAGPEAQKHFRDRIKAAEHVLVWVGEKDNVLYQKISKVIPKSMGKIVNICTPDNHEGILNNLLGEDPLAAARADQKAQMQADLDYVPPKSGEITEDANLKTAIRVEDTATSVMDWSQKMKHYVDLMKTYAIYNQRRDMLESDVTKDTTLESILIQQKRWEKMALSYRKTAAEFKAWPVKEPQGDIGGPKALWDSIQTLGKEQSDVARRIMDLRESLFSDAQASPEMARYLKPWPGVEEAGKVYFSRIMFDRAFRAALDSGDLPEPESDDEKSGFFKSKEEKLLEEAEAALKDFMNQEERSWKSLVAAEIDGIDKDLVVRFWEFYEAVAVYWSDLETKPEFTRDNMRLFMRSAYTGTELMGINADDKKHLAHVYTQEKLDYQFTDGETHAVYFDEYLELFKKHVLAPSYDENLELNDRGSDEWKMARQLRKTSYQLRMQAIYKAKKKTLEETLTKLEEEYGALEAKLAETPKTKKKEYAAIKDKAHDKKVARSRTKEMITKMDEELDLIAKEGIETGFSDEFPLSHWVKKEVANLRSKVRLMNRLRERHLPTVLAEELGNFNDKICTTQGIRDIMASILANDLSACDLVLVPHKKRAFSLIASVPPVIMIAPGTGEIGFTMEPAGDMSEGRIILPRKPKGSQDLRSMFMDCLSDYRWDTAMIQAGADWVTSDSFVAAYARCRWDYRNKNKDTREKAWVDKEDTDKRNFRRHYSLLERSMDEGGKLLYYKSKMIYQNLIKYFPLPPGVDKIRD